MGALIIGTGSYVPSRVVTNQDLLQFVDLSGYDAGHSGPYPDWVRKVMGFEQRRWAAADQATSDLALEAARRALAEADLSPRDIDLIIVTTTTPDRKVPNTASILQHKLGAGGYSMAFDISTACSGFVYGLHVAEAMLAHHRDYHYALLVSAEKSTTIMDTRDYITGATFGDGAGAVVLAKSADDAHGILCSYARSDGDKEHWVEVPAGGSALPITNDNWAEIHRAGWHCLQLKAHDVKDFAVAKIVEAVGIVLGQAGLGLADVAYVLPHQPGRRILEEASKALGLPYGKVLANYQRYGNTSQASIPILLDENRGLFRTGDHLVLAGVGAAFGWGAVLYRWRDLAEAAWLGRRPVRKA